MDNPSVKKFKGYLDVSDGCWRRMLVTVYVGDNFEILLADLRHWKSHQHDEKSRQGLGNNDFNFWDRSLGFELQTLKASLLCYGIALSPKINLASDFIKLISITDHHIKPQKTPTKIKHKVRHDNIIWRNKLEYKLYSLFDISYYMIHIIIWSVYLDMLH